MNLAMVSAAKWDCEFIAHLATQRAALCKAQLTGIRGSTIVNQARLLGHVSNVLPVAYPMWLWQRIDARLFPPCRFIAISVDLPMMATTQGDRKLIADFSGQGSLIAQIADDERRPDGARR